MRSLPEELLREHGCHLAHRERPWQQVLRLNQSLWRQEQAYTPLTLPNGGYLGSILCADGAEAHGHNLMSAAALRVARREALAGRKQEKVVDAERLFTNLLTSQALCFSLFGDLQEDLDLASRVLSTMLDDPIEVLRVELEYSPGRGDLTYTGDRSAADAYVEYQRGEIKGFLCIEVKYHEDLQPRRTWTDPYRPRYSELAELMGCFRAAAEPTLRKPPLEQLWRDHLLTGAILHHPKERFGEGAFVLLYPSLNEACVETIDQYRKCLSDQVTFRTWKLETFLDALDRHADHEWVRGLRDRYCDFRRIDWAYQDFYLRQTSNWAQAIRDDLGVLQDREAHRVQFRPSTTGVTMVGLLPDKPQLGKSYRSTSKVVNNFEEEFRKHCNGAPPRRLTPEKQLQSFLVADALVHRRHMNVLNKASGETDAETDLILLTDELVIPSVRGDQRLDILALRRHPGGHRLVLIELKSERAMKELLRQTAEYAEFLMDHPDALSRLATAILGEHVAVNLPPEKWIVWPQEGEREDPREAELLRERVRTVGYRQTRDVFSFRVGNAPDGQSS